MVAHLRRFTNMYPVAVVVAADLSEPAIFREEEDRRVHGGHSLPEPRAPARTPFLRHPHAHSAE